MPNLKVLTICDVLFPHTVGGAGRVAREVAAALERRGVDVRFLTRRVAGSVGDDRIATAYLPALWLAPLGSFPRILQQQIDAFQPDIIHAHQPLPAYLSVPRRRPLPLVYTFHSSWPEELKVKSSRWPARLRAPLSRVYAAVERRVIQSAAGVTVLSEFSRTCVRQFYERDATVIAGGVDSSRFAPVDRVGPSNPLQLITLRNLVPRMGLDALIRAVALLPSEVRLTIGGEGPLKGDLETLVRQLGLADRVRLPGHIPEAELPSFYSSGDWFVLPTAALEGFGLVILESLACGTPVLGTRIGAIPEVLERFNAAWVIENSSPQAIAATIGSAMKTLPPSRASLHARVAAEFDWNHIAEKYEQVFHSLLSEFRSGGPVRL